MGGIVNKILNNAQKQMLQIRVTMIYYYIQEKRD